jgi:hypothetical protein
MQEREPQDAIPPEYQPQPAWPQQPQPLQPPPPQYQQPPYYPPPQPVVVNVVQQNNAYAPRRAVYVQRRINHKMHFWLTFWTGGAWGLFVWLPLAIKGGKRVTVYR